MSYICHSLAMDEAWHVQQLQCHCCVCGSRLRKSGAGYVGMKYECTSLATEIKATFDLDTSMDNMWIHPTHMCWQCYNALQKQQLDIKTCNTTVHFISLFDWEAHSDSFRVNKYIQHATLINHMHVHAHCRLALTSLKLKQVEDHLGDLLQVDDLRIAQ